MSRTERLTTVPALSSTPEVMPGSEDYVTFMSLAASSNWGERQWRTAVEKGHLPAYELPTGRVIVKMPELLEFIAGFADPPRVGVRKRSGS